MDPAEVTRLMHARGICVVIPIYNNVGTAASVVTAAKAYSQDIIVVDDGSTDGTTEALQQIDGITLVHYARNRGKGYALKTGFRRALTMGFAYAVTMDGDGQHYAHDIATLLEANRKHPGALIVGQRRLEGVERSRGSQFANEFSNFWFWVQTGQRLEDTQTGLRLYPLRHLHGLGLLTARYEAELELLVFASWHGVKLVATPVDVYYPPREERVSHFRPAADFLRITVLNTVFCLLAIIYGLPLRLGRGLLRVVRTVYSLLFFIILTVFIATPLTWFYAHVGPMTEHKRMRLHRFIYHSMRFIMIRHGIPGVRFTWHEAQAQDTVDHEGETQQVDEPRIIICNHESHLDLAAQLIFTPRVIFLTKDWVWHNPFYGFLIRHCEYYPVSTGLDDLLPQLRDVVSRGYSIAVYPECTRSEDCRIPRFHQGAFNLAQQLSLPIQPMVLYGTGKVLPKHGRSLHKGHIHIETKSIISRTELDAMGSTMAQARELHHRYQQWYDDLANNIEQEA